METKLHKHQIQQSKVINPIYSGANLRKERKFSSKIQTFNKKRLNKLHEMDHVVKRGILSTLKIT